MSEDWKPGDLAVCVNRRTIICDKFAHTGGNCAALTGPAEVVSVEVKSCGCIRLRFAASSGVAQRFRKVRPDQHEPCEAEFITLLNRTKRKVGA